MPRNRCSPLPSLEVGLLEPSGGQTAAGDGVLHLVRLEETPSDLPQQADYRTGLLDLRRNRFVVRETVEGLTAAKAKKRKKARWRLETSCWAPRKASGNSLDFFETSKAMRRLFDIDWIVASKAHELSWYVLRALVAIISRRCMPTALRVLLQYL